MKKITKILLVMLIFFISSNVFAAADYTYRTKRDNRVKVSINGYDLYLSVSVLFNMKDGYATERIPIETFDAELKDDTFYVTVKRSELNKVFKNNTYDNVYSYFEIAADFLDFKEDKQYFYVEQHTPESKPDEEYYLAKSNQDFYYRNYKFLEVANSAADLIGYANEARSAAQGGYALYELDSLPTFNKPSSETYNLSELSEYTPLFKLNQRKSTVTIIEDVQMDLGENNKIVSPYLTEKENGEVIQEIIEVDNFYAEYLDNNKMSYSWTMYDTEGKPLEISVDTTIAMDNSENEEEILSLFGNEFDNIKDRIKIISFKHDGDLGGKAKISLYVGDKFAPGSLVTLLYFNPVENTLENLETGIGDAADSEPNAERYTVLVDNDGYIAIELTHCSEYVVAEEEVAKKVSEEKKEDTKKDEEKKDKKDNKLLIALIVSGVVLLVTIVTVIIIAIKKKKNNKELTIE